MELPQTLPGVPAPGIDPEQNELASISTLKDIFSWLGSADDLLVALVKALGGGSPKLRDLAFVKSADWDEAVSKLQLVVPGDGESAQSTTRAPSAFEAGHLVMVRRIARLRLGLTANVESSTGPPGALPASEHLETTGQPMPPGSAAVQPMHLEPVVKLSAVLDPTIDASLVRIKQQEVRRMFSEYKDARGAEPAEDVSPTEEQVSAVKQILDCDRYAYKHRSQGHIFNIW